MSIHSMRLQLCARLLRLFSLVSNSKKSNSVLGNWIAICALGTTAFNQMENRKLLKYRAEQLLRTGECVYPNRYSMQQQLKLACREACTGVRSPYSLTEGDKKRFLNRAMRRAQRAKNALVFFLFRSWKNIFFRAQALGPSFWGRHHGQYHLWSIQPLL